MKADNLNQQVGVLIRREIEARILKPVYDLLSLELGPEKAQELLKTVVIKEAKELGKTMRENSPDASLQAFAEQWEPWFRGGALEIEVIEKSDEAWHFNVKRCRYAEMYRDLGMADLGLSLSCNRDAALVEGYSDDIGFERSQTLMQGAAFCDFRYRKKG